MQAQRFFAVSLPCGVQGSIDGEEQDFRHIQGCPRAGKDGGDADTQRDADFGLGHVTARRAQCLEGSLNLSRNPGCAGRSCGWEQDRNVFGAVVRGVIRQA